MKQRRSLPDLIAQWRAEADHFERHGALPNAATKRAAASELELALTEAENQLVTREQAAELSGYSPDAITRLVRQGRIHNYGKPGSPRVRIGDLPRKPSGGAPASLSLADNTPVEQRQVDAGIVRAAIADKVNSLHRRGRA